MTKNGLTYAKAGVDIDAGNALVDRIKPAAARTNRPGTMAGLGGCLVSCFVYWHFDSGDLRDGEFFRMGVKTEIHAIGTAGTTRPAQGYLLPCSGARIGFF